MRIWKRLTLAHPPAGQKSEKFLFKPILKCTHPSFRSVQAVQLFYVFVINVQHNIIFLLLWYVLAFNSIQINLCFLNQAYFHILL